MVNGNSTMQYEVSNPVSMNHDMTAAAHYASQNLYVPNGTSRIKSENGSERGVSPHASEQSSRYSSQTPQASMAFQMSNQLSNGMRYPSPSQLGQQAAMPSFQQHSYHPHGQADQQFPTSQLAQQIDQQDQAQPEAARQGSSSSLPKAFACSTCAKGFARRSDLARHGE